LITDISIRVVKHSLLERAMASLAKSVNSLMNFNQIHCGRYTRVYD